MAKTTMNPRHHGFVDAPSGIVLSSGAVPHRASVKDAETIGDFTAITDWTVFGNDTVNLAVASSHILGTKSIEFDKVDGAANQKYAGCYATIPSVDLSRFIASAQLQTAIYISNTVDVDYAFIRLGTDASNYNEWRIADASITGAVWDPLAVLLSACELTVTGVGWDMSAVTYVAIGVMFDLETDALADIRFDHLLIANV